MSIPPSRGDKSGLHVKRENFRLLRIFSFDRGYRRLLKESIREIGVADKFELNRRLACGDPEFRITAANLFSFQDY